MLLDRARFPSDTVSSHQVQAPGASALHRWGLLDTVLAGQRCAVEQVRLEVDGVAMTGRLPSVDGIGSLVSPRRTRLDELLVQAASDAGAAVEQRVTLDEVQVERGRAVGVRVRMPSGRRASLPAHLVIGADGKNSFVGKAVGATVTRRRPHATVALYSYWAGVPVTRAELYHQPGRAVAVFPTDDGLTVVFLAVPVSAFAEARHDPETFLLRGLDACGEIGGRVRAGHRVERVRLTPDVPHLMRRPAGPGWALVGDAGMVMDPVSAQGISNAFLSAENLDQWVGAALSAGQRSDARLAAYARWRDATFTGMFDFTSSLAALDARSGTRMLMSRVSRRQDEVDRLLAVFSGVEPPSRFFSAPHMARLLGWRAPGVFLQQVRPDRRNPLLPQHHAALDSRQQVMRRLPRPRGMGGRLDPWTTN